MSPQLDLCSESDKCSLELIRETLAVAACNGLMDLGRPTPQSHYPYPALRSPRFRCACDAAYFLVCLPTKVDVQLSRSCMELKVCRGASEPNWSPANPLHTVAEDQYS